MASNEPPPWEINGNRLKIENGRKLGDGQYSNVYLAKWDKKGDGDVEQVAAKVIPKTEKTEKEIGILYDLSKNPHPNIIKFHGAVRDLCNTVTLITEVAECSVYDFVQMQRQLKKRLQPAHIMQWAREAARAIKHLHDNDIIHRDVKSPNLLIMKDGTLKLCDFGIADTGATHTKTTGQKKGSYRWMAPEVFKKRVSKRSDIFSYGTFIWEMVTCEEPYYQYQEDPELIHKIMYEEEDLTIPEDCPEILKKIITDCRQRERENRPDIEEILEVLEGENVEEDANQLDIDFSDFSIHDVHDGSKIQETTLQGWKAVLRLPHVRKRITESIVPNSVLPDLSSAILKEEEQQIKAMETNKGPILGADLLLDFLEKSTDDQWPDKLMKSLTPSDDSPAILVEFLQQEMSSYQDCKGQDGASNVVVGRKGRISSEGSGMAQRDYSADVIATELDLEFLVRKSVPGALESLYRHLEIERPTIEQVRVEYRDFSFEEASIAILRTWLMGKGRYATRSALLSACKKSENLKVAHKLEDKFKKECA